jgi:CRP/FNR family cyclic AMP-dependent transcriptional regulator
LPISLIKRFEADKQKVYEAILNQQCVSHNAALAKALCKKLVLVPLKRGDTLISQGENDNDIFFVLAGKIAIHVNGNELAQRGPQQHVGEMALIDISATRSASAIALEDSVVAKVSEPSFTVIANSFPEIWRRLAIELASRLRERTKFVRTPNPRPIIFIGSAGEGLDIAKEIQSGLSHSDVVPQLWTNNVFIPGHGTMEDLESTIKNVDFGVLVFTPDDKVINKKRRVNKQAPRDNVVLELGMCLGVLGRSRSLLVHPKNKDLKIPSDYLGLTPIPYDGDDPKNISAHISSVCTAIMKVVKRENVRGDSCVNR